VHGRTGGEPLRRGRSFVGKFVGKFIGKFVGKFGGKWVGKGLRRCACTSSHERRARRLPRIECEPIRLVQSPPNSRSKSMNKDQVQGRTEQAKGKVKEVAGKVVGNKRLETEGKVDQVAGKTEANYGNAKEKAKDAIDRLP
jgi:uncharacterized protein YjbJ (UPF0337 family)